MEDTYERHYAEGKFGELELGLYIIRAENLVLLGEMDEQKERMYESVLQQVPVEEVLELKKKVEEEGADTPDIVWNFDE